MKTNQNRVNLEFAPEIRFAVQTVPAGPFRTALENDFEQLKRQLLAKKLAAVKCHELAAPVRRAANEAAALAWVTQYPLLVFPALFEEKAAAAVRQAARQARIYAQTREILAA